MAIGHTMDPTRIAELRALALLGSVPGTSLVDALDEVERLRGLPVLSTCGECRHHMPIETTDPVDYAWCGHDDAPGSESYDAKTPYYAAPPIWCPLRRKGATP